MRVGVRPGSGLQTSSATIRFTGHLAALDTLRGIAIILVLLVHYLVRAPMLPTVFGTALHGVAAVGSYGVDLFFVLSGFLITGILLDTRGAPGYFRTFYARRTLRVLPLYYAALVIIFLVLPNLHGGLRGVPHVTFARQVPYWAYFANFIMAFGDWGASTRHTPHFWTLAVEEQFYLVWPALVLWAGTRRMIPLSLAFIAGALALRTGLVLAGAIPTMTTLATPCRVDALAIGALIATIVRRPDLVTRVRLAFPGFAVCFAAVLGLIAWRGNLAESDPIIRTFGISLIGVMFGMLVAVAIQVQPGTLIYRCFTFAPLRLVGRYSYGIYVIHYPVMILLGDYGWSYTGLAARYGSPAVAEALLVIVNTAVTFALAVASFHLLEKPFLSLKRYFSYAREVAPSIDVDLTASPEPAA